MIYYSRIVVSELPHYREQHDNKEQVSDATESPEETTESDAPENKGDSGRLDQLKERVTALEKAVKSRYSVRKRRSKQTLLTRKKRQNCSAMSRKRI